MSPIKYYSMVKSKDKEFVFGIRLQVVRDALEKGIESGEDINPEVLTLPALDLDKLFEIKFGHSPPVGGHDVPGLSSS